jgi:hypothetical protein
MRMVKGRRSIGCVGTVAVTLAFLLAASAVYAQGEERFTVERPSSVLIFPKVVREGSNRQTTIQITNTSNMLVHAHCFYVNGSALNGVPLWQVIDFSITLTRQQPTSWTADEGRPIDPTDDQTGLDPGPVPPVPPGFAGGLVCVQINVDGNPSVANSLKGEATISETNDLEQLVAVGKYNAVGIQGIDDDPNEDTLHVLRLDNVEYAACPSGAYLNFVPEGAQDDIINGFGNGPSAVSTTLALLPCAMDLENLLPGRTVAAFQFRDEFELGPSLAPVPVECWTPFNLADAPVTPATSSTFWHARITAVEPAPGAGGFVGVANVQRVGANGAIASSLANLHFLGNREEGFCAISGGECTTDVDCTGGAGDTCRRNLGARCSVDGDICLTDADCADGANPSDACLAPEIRLPKALF